VPIPRPTPIGIEPGALLRREYRANGEVQVAHRGSQPFPYFAPLHENCQNFSACGAGDTGSAGLFEYFPQRGQFVCVCVSE
jgi:hypothetical protein